jgi:hypothetical protein
MLTIEALFVRKPVQQSNCPETHRNLDCRTNQPVTAKRLSADKATGRACRSGDLRSILVIRLLLAYAGR